MRNAFAPAVLQRTAGRHALTELAMIFSLMMEEL
jgi:hypothetical protein